MRGNLRIWKDSRPLPLRFMSDELSVWRRAPSPRRFPVSNKNSASACRWVFVSTLRLCLNLFSNGSPFLLVGQPDSEGQLTPKTSMTFQNCGFCNLIQVRKFGTYGLGLWSFVKIFIYQNREDTWRQSLTAAAPSALWSIPPSAYKGRGLCWTFSVQIEDIFI